MESEYYRQDKLLLVKLTKDVDDANVQKIRRKIDYDIERCIPKKVVFDFSNVSFMDSSGIGLIVGRYKLITMLGGEVELANINNSIRRIFEMSGILKMIPTVNLKNEDNSDFILNRKESANIE